VTYPFTRALVTGASSGIGEAIARELGNAGVSLVVTARRRDRLQDIAAAFPGTEVLVADLETKAGRTRVEQRLAVQDEPVDLLVNNAGFGTTGAFAGLDADRSQREIELNVVALTRLTRAALPRMVADGRGWICNVASVAAFQAAPRLAVYAATKAYVLSFSEALHEEVRGTGVVVSALCPGLTRTEFQSVSNSADYMSRYPAMAWLSAEQVAREGLTDCARGRAVSVPGYQYKSMVAASSFVPRSIVRRVAGMVQRF
jgi:hypothetical protein